MLSEQQKVNIAKRLRQAKSNLMQSSPFFAVLLSYVKLSLDEGCDTAYTDGQRIAFSPAFVEKLSNTELQFIFCHEIMHVALRHLTRPGAAFKNRVLWNVATDIVVNSNVAAAFGIGFITLQNFGVSMHLAPDGKEGCLYAAEEVYDMLLDKCIASSGGAGAGEGGDAGFDNHNHWQDNSENADADDEIWRERVMQAAEVADGSRRVSGQGCGGMPPAMERLVRQLAHPQTDWRTLLNNFVQEEVCDYSFNPPDRRFQDDFILPDFNDKTEKVKNVLFMVDTSGSISDEMLTQAYGEIKGAIDQFDGNLEGYIGFFDHGISPAVPFASVDELLKIRPKGGGGTSFENVFRYVTETFCKENEAPASIIMLTDGRAAFPAEEAACGIPVLWLLNDESITPPWGAVARVTV